MYQCVCVCGQSLHSTPQHDKESPGEIKHLALPSIPRLLSNSCSNQTFSHLRSHTPNALRSGWIPHVPMAPPTAHAASECVLCTPFTLSVNVCIIFPQFPLCIRLLSPLCDYVLVDLTFYTRATASLGIWRPPCVTVRCQFAASNFVSETSSFSSTCTYTSCTHVLVHRMCRHTRGKLLPRITLQRCNACHRAGLSSVV